MCMGGGGGGDGARDCLENVHNYVAVILPYTVLYICVCVNV